MITNFKSRVQYLLTKEEIKRIKKEHNLDLRKKASWTYIYAFISVRPFFSNVPTHVLASNGTIVILREYQDGYKAHYLGYNTETPISQAQADYMLGHYALVDVGLGFEFIDNPHMPPTSVTAGWSGSTVDNIKYVFSEDKDKLEFYHSSINNTVTVKLPNNRFVAVNHTMPWNEVKKVLGV